MTGIHTYSTTASENVQANTGINWDEGMPPSAVNNSARQNMADIRGRWNDAAWFQYGIGSKSVTATYASSTSITLAGGDATTAWHTGRRVKAVGSSTGTIYGKVSSSSYSSGTTTTTVNFTWDSGSLSNETLTVYLSAPAPVTGKPIAPEAIGGGTIGSAIAVSDTNFSLQDDGDATKIAKFQLSGLTTGTTRTLTVPDASTIIVGTDATQTLTNKTITIADANFTLQDDGDATKQAKFQLSGITTGNTRTFTVPDASDTLATLAATQTLQNKTLDNTTAITIKDANLTLQDDGDATKQAKFQLSGITAGNTRTITIPDASDTMAVLGASQTYTGTPVYSNGIDLGSPPSWTPIDSSGAGLSLTVTAAKITKIGKLRIAQANITYPTTASGIGVTIGGLPDASSTSNVHASAIPWCDAASGVCTSSIILPNSTTMSLYKSTGSATANSDLSGKSLYLCAIYTVA